MVLEFQKGGLTDYVYYVEDIRGGFPDSAQYGHAGGGSGRVDRKQRARVQAACLGSSSVQSAPTPCESWGGWRWLERRLMYREMMQRERRKSEEQSVQLDFLSVLGLAA